MDSMIDSDNHFAEICRICLERRFEMTSIFNCENSALISDRIMSCSKVIIIENDNFPSNICSVCLGELNIAVKFKEKSENSDKILQSCLRKVKFTKQDGEIDYAGLSDNVERRKKSTVESDKKEYPVIDESSFKLEIECDLEEHSTVSLCDTVDNVNLKIEDEEHKSFETLVLGVKTKQQSKYKVRIKKDEIKCNVCMAVFMSQRNLSVHMKSHVEELGYRCHSCPEVFSTNVKLRIHRRLEHNQEKQVCSECGKRFKCLTYLKRHLVRHLSVKPFGCAVCEKRFATKAYLKEHLARHRGDKRYSCEVCGVKFVSSVNLNQHRCTHGLHLKDYKSHECTFCEYRTTGQVDLARHMRKHTGEKPFRCTWDGCTSSFVRKTTLDLHYRIHTGEKPFMCHECPMAFSRRDKFRKHMIKKHEISEIGPTRRSRLLQVVVDEMVP